MHVLHLEVQAGLANGQKRVHHTANTAARLNRIKECPKRSSLREVNESWLASRMFLPEYHEPPIHRTCARLWVARTKTATRYLRAYCSFKNSWYGVRLAMACSCMKHA